MRPKRLNCKTNLEEAKTGECQERKKETANQGPEGTRTRGGRPLAKQGCRLLKLN